MMLTVFTVFTRRLLRRMGLTRHANACVRFLTGRRDEDYEREVEQFVRATLRPADVVWDVGANRGLYTAMLSGLVGSEGTVVAIEPEAANMAHLASSSWPLDNVTLVHAALTDHDGEISLFVNSADDTGRTHSTTQLASRNTPAQTVPCFSADSLVQRRLAPPPTFVKIDVEGTEEKVLAGMTGILESRALRGVLVEVHFAILERQGRPYAPVEIENLLRSKQLTVRWLDRSHIVGKRDSAGGSAVP